MNEKFKKYLTRTCEQTKIIEIEKRAIDQIEHIDNFSIKSYCVGQVFVTNEII